MHFCMTNKALKTTLFGCWIEFYNIPIYYIRGVHVHVSSTLHTLNPNHV